ncbi:MAG: rhomboid family intramembrane serine protease [Parasporobacterium sp.]|nr:rhomboid family intramembrane serine protease [Parasporobacterium sp.]
MGRIRELAAEKKLPYVTIVLIVINVAYYLIVAFGGSTFSMSYMLSRGADYSPLVFEGHEYWRLLTCMFLHFSLRHLAGNMVYLGIVGWSYEGIVGHLKFFLVYMLSGIGSSVVSCAWHQLSGEYAVSAGASGAVYGIIAMVIYLMYIAKKRTGSRILLSRIAVILVFLLYSNFVSGEGVDVAAHVGGLFFGVLLSLLFLPYKKKGRTY